MYNKKAALYYDYFVGKGDIPFFRRLLLRLGGAVLDMGCGTGTMALDFAGAGLEVVGVDNSPYMLDMADSRRDKLTPRVKERVEFVEGDMQDFPWDHQFSTAIFARGSFAHLLSSEEQMACLANVRKLLEVGGRIVLDLSPPSIEFLQGGTKLGETVGVDGDIKLLRTIHTRCDLNRQLCHHTVIYEQYRGGVLQERVLGELSLSLLFPREVMLLLQASGFSIQEIYGDAHGESFTSASRRLIVVASK